MNISDYTNWIKEEFMPGERVTMRKVREVLRLKFDGSLSNRQIGKSCSLGKSTVADYLERFRRSGLSWPLKNDLDDTSLEGFLFSPSESQSCENRPMPDWAYIHSELRRKAVTLMLLWQEYKQQYPDGYQYSRFCELYGQWKGKIDPVMRQVHIAGEKTFVDYAGMTVAVNDQSAGEPKEAQVFIAVLGASSYTYAEATWTQSLPDWIGSHIRAFAFFGGVSKVLVPDNLKSGVNKACFYEPDINLTYLEMARHYGIAVIPARVAKPKDKAKAEAGVLLAERWILAKLRNRPFFSLHQLNEAIFELLDELNNKAFQKLAGSRKSVFESCERPALMPLPAVPYQFAQWKIARVNIDYHIDVERHYYSVPYQLIHKQVDVRYTDTTVECFYKNKRVASHIRSHVPGHHTTVKEHMPESHRKWLEWTPKRFINWAAKIGPDTKALIERILGSRVYPQQAFRSCLGILRLSKGYGNDRLEAASKRALAIGAVSYRSVESILKNNLDKKPLRRTSDDQPAVDHDNIRGAGYYN
jgi:transposase